MTPARIARNRIATAIAGVVACLLTGCAAARRPDSTGHPDGITWKRAIHQFADDGSQWIAPAVLAVATPIVWAADKDISEDSLSQKVFNTNTQTGDTLAIGLGAVPLAWGLVETVGGDPRLLEVGAESLAATMVASYSLKSVINKERPDGTTEDSFPSAHTSFAFAGATLIAREVRDRSGSWLGYLAYVPASYVGISRLEGQRHYLADITFGAALGMLLTNLVYDAHHGEPGAPGIFGTDSPIRASVGPSPDGPGVMVGLSWTF